MWLLCFGLAACGNAPTPVIGALDPRLVCGSGTLPLAVHGSNFLARPVRTLGGGVALEVPSAVLLPPSGTTVFPEVVWYSTELVGLRVPVDQLALSEYTLELRDPDGQSARLERALSRIEAPAVDVAQVTPGALCIHDANNSISVQGSGFLAGATVSIRDGSGTVVLRPTADVTSGAVTLTLAAQALPPGEYTLVVENPQQGGCTATATAPLVIDPPPALAQIVSGALCMGGGQVTVTGTDLQEGATVELRDASLRLAATSVAVTGGTRAVLSFPMNTFPKNETADLYWHNPDGCSSTLAGSVRVKPGTGGCN
jgi:hypothetical protein